MKVIIAAAALAIVAAFPAAAQYYGEDLYGRDGRYYEEDFGRPSVRRGPRPGYEWEPRGYYGERPRERFNRRAYGQGFGRVCVTSRGNCAGPPVPINSRCRCDIPGFGLKRGNVLY